MKLKNFPIYVGAVIMVLFAVPVVVVYAFNLTLFVEKLVYISETINPIAGYAIFFGLTGIFAGMFTAAKKFSLKKSYYINATTGIILLFLLFFYLNKPHNFQTLGEHAEQVAFAEVEKIATYNSAERYLRNFPEGKNVLFVDSVKKSILLDSAENVNSPGLWQYYLSQFPMAENREQVKSVIDDLDWKIALKSNFKSAYTLYIAKHPDGKYVKNAKIKISRIQKREQYLAKEKIRAQQQIEAIETADAITTGQTGNTIDKTESDINQKSGYQTLEFPDGRKYIGMVANGNPQGNGKEIFPDGSVLTGFYQNGKRSGKFIYTSAGGIKEEQEFNAGNRIK